MSSRTARRTGRLTYRQGEPRPATRYTEFSLNRNSHAMYDPRATRILLPRQHGITTELWMGGANTGIGDALSAEQLAGAWVIDCAGDMPDEYRAAAGLWLYRVFSDVEEVPAAWPRINALATSIGRCLAGAAGQTTDHPDLPPPRLFVLCTQGLNRSGLVMGRVLRALGVSGEEACAIVTRHRPGALNNLTFARMVREHDGS